MHWNLLDTEVLNWRYSTMPPGQFYGELFEIRQMIEPQAAALAAERATAREIAEIAEAFDADDRSSPPTTLRRSKPTCCSTARFWPPATMRCCCSWAT